MFKHYMLMVLFHFVADIVLYKTCKIFQLLTPKCKQNSTQMPNKF